MPKAQAQGGSFWARTESKWKIFWIISLISLVADQATKIWARASLPVHPAGCRIPEDIIARKCMGTSVKFIEGYWEWRLSMNPGSAFGLFGSFGADFTRVFLSLIGVGAVVGLYVLDQFVLEPALDAWKEQSERLTALRENVTKGRSLPRPPGNRQPIPRSASSGRGPRR